MNFHRILLPCLTGAILCLAGFLLYRIFQRHDFVDVLDSVRMISGDKLALAFGFALASYICLTGFDAIGVRYAGKSLPYHKIALTSFIALSIGQNIGLAMLSSGAVRYRFYTRWGLRLSDVGKILLISGTTVGLGLATLGGIGLLLTPQRAAEMIGISSSLVLLAAAATLSLPLLYVILSALNISAFGLFKWRIKLPHLSLALAQVFIGTLNFACVSACIATLASIASDISYFHTATVYVLANTASLISHVPGGLGVLETTFLVLLPGAATISVLIAFRTIYFFIPLLLGLLLLVLSEYVFDRSRRKRSEGAPSKP